MTLEGVVVVVALFIVYVVIDERRKRRLLRPKPCVSAPYDDWRETACHRIGLVSVGEGPVLGMGAESEPWDWIKLELTGDVILDIRVASDVSGLAADQVCGALRIMAASRMPSRMTTAYQTGLDATPLAVGTASAFRQLGILADSAADFQQQVAKTLCFTTRSSSRQELVAAAERAGYRVMETGEGVSGFLFPLPSEMAEERLRADCEHIPGLQLTRCLAGSAWDVLQAGLKDRPFAYLCWDSESWIVLVDAGGGDQAAQWFLLENDAGFVGYEVRFGY